MDDKESVIKRIGMSLRVAYETLTLAINIFLLLITVASVGAVVGIATKDISLLLIGFGAIVLFIMGIIVVISIANKRPKFETRVNRKYVSYRYFPDGKTMGHTKRYEITCLANSVDSFIDRYKWSCEQQQRCKVTLLTEDKHQRLIETKEHEWRLNVIRFDPSLKKGEKTQVVLSWDLFCEGGSVPFLSQPVESPTDYLELSVTVPEEPDEIKYIHFNDMGGTETNRSTVIEIHDGEYNRATGEIRYEIHSPNLRHKYMIRWTPKPHILALPKENSDLVSKTRPSKEITDSETKSAGK